MGDRSWRLRPAGTDDRDFLYALNEATMRAHVEKVWGWDDEKQIAFFENRFQPDVWQIIEADGRDVGLLIVRHDVDQISLAEIQIDPGWQSRGIGSSVVRSLIREATRAEKPLTLRVLHVNRRARRLYERLGFFPYKETDTHVYLRYDG
jgi:ribosomal protein S18 acetylase RimI-like enzyme